MIINNYYIIVTVNIIFNIIVRIHIYIFIYKLYDTRNTSLRIIIKQIDLSLTYKTCYVFSIGILYVYIYNYLIDGASETHSISIDKHFKI